MDGLGAFEVAREPLDSRLARLRRSHARGRRRARLQGQERHAGAAGEAHRALARARIARLRHGARADASRAPGHAAPAPGGPGVQGAPRAVRSGAWLDERIEGVEVVVGPLAHGVILPADGLVLVTEEEIFGACLRIGERDRARSARHHAPVPRRPAQPGPGRLRGARRARHRALPGPGAQDRREPDRRSHRRRIRERRQAVSAGPRLNQLRRRCTAGEQAAAPKVDRSRRARPSRCTKARVARGGCAKDGRRAAAPLRRTAGAPRRGHPGGGRRLPRLRGDVSLRRDPRSGARISSTR